MGKKLAPRKTDPVTVVFLPTHGYGTQKIRVIRTNDDEILNQENKIHVNPEENYLETNGRCRSQETVIRNQKLNLGENGTSGH